MTLLPSSPTPTLMMLYYAPYEDFDPKEFFYACRNVNLRKMKKLKYKLEDNVFQYWIQHAREGWCRSSLLHALFENHTTNYNEQNCLEILRLCIQQGADINAREYNVKATPLHFACCSSIPSVVKEMLILGADPNTQDISGNTPMHEVLLKASTSSIFPCDYEMIRVLMDYGANEMLANCVDMTSLDLLDKLSLVDAKIIFDIIEEKKRRGYNTKSAAKNGR